MATNRLWGLSVWSREQETDQFRPETENKVEYVMVVRHIRIRTYIASIILVQGLAADPTWAWYSPKSRLPRDEAVRHASGSAAFAHLGSSSCGPFELDAQPEYYPQQAYDAGEVVSLHALAQKKDCFWPRDLLPGDFPHARVCTYAYQSEWHSDRFTTDIKECGEQMLKSLSEKRETKHAESRPIIFIGHSFGGLVIQSALATARSEQSEPRHAKIAECCVGIIFLGTPFQGTRFAKPLDIYNKARRNNQPVIEALKPNNEELQVLQARFWDSINGRRPEMVCFYEKLKSMHGKAILVSQESACLPNNVRNLPMLADHRKMNKFYGVDDPNYIQLRSELNTIYRNALRFRGAHSVERTSNDAQIQQSPIAATDKPSGYDEPQSAGSQEQHMIPSPSSGRRSRIDSAIQSVVDARRAKIGDPGPSLRAHHSPSVINVRPASLQQAMDFVTEEVSRRQQTSELGSTDPNAASGSPEFRLSVSTIHNAHSQCPPSAAGQQPGGHSLDPKGQAIHVRGYNWLLDNAKAIVEGHISRRIALAGFSGTGKADYLTIFRSEVEQCQNVKVVELDASNMSNVMVGATQQFVEFRSMDDALRDLGRTKYCSSGRLVLIVHGLNSQEAVTSLSRASSPVNFPHSVTVVATNLLEVARSFVSSHGTLITFDPELACHQQLWPQDLDLDDFARLPSCWRSVPGVVKRLHHLWQTGVMSASECFARIWSLISSPAEAQDLSTQTALRRAKRHFCGDKVAREKSPNLDHEAHQTYLVILACMERAWLRLLWETNAHCPEALRLLVAMAATDRTALDQQWVSAAGSVSALRYLESRCLVWHEDSLTAYKTWHYNAAMQLAIKIWLADD